MARARKGKAVIPDNISEEYYQISQEILSSFPKYRPPVDLFQFREDIAQLYPYSRKGARLSNEQVEEVQVLCDAGSLFVSRTDHPIYSEHIVKQVDLVLLDANLKESECADIFVRAMRLRLSEFIDQPVRPVFEVFYRDLMVLTEFFWQDKHRIKLFMRRLHTGDHDLINHSLNTLFVGMWLFIYTYTGEDFKRRHMDRAALALILHDIGMSRIPPFILQKTQSLKPDEKDKIFLHQLAGAKILQKLNIAFDELTQAIMEHHERLDGSGYPNRLKENQLSKFGRLCTVADSFAAMITTRPYAPAKDYGVASQELASDKARYDARFTVPLANAYLTSRFDLRDEAKEEAANEAQGASQDEAADKGGAGA